MTRSLLDAERAGRRWTGLAFLASVLVAAATIGFLLTRPTGPAGAVPASRETELAAEHDCLPPVAWNEQRGLLPGAGAILGSGDPGMPEQVVWVPAGDVTRWQPTGLDHDARPGWWLRQWCTR